MFFHGTKSVGGSSCSVLGGFLRTLRKMMGLGEFGLLVRAFTANWVHVLSVGGQTSSEPPRTGGMSMMSLPCRSGGGV